MAEAAHHDQAAPREVTGVTGVKAKDLSKDALQICQLGILHAQAANASFAHLCRDVGGEGLI